MATETAVSGPPDHPPRGEAVCRGKLRLTSLPVNSSLEAFHPRKKKSYERVPPSMKSNFHLTHPDLTKGQKRYLWSICSIYSTAQMKRLIQDQFIRQCFYEMSKGIIRVADWNKYLEYLMDPKKRKHQFQSVSARTWKAPPDQYKFRYYRDHPVDLPKPMLPAYVDYEIENLTRVPEPPPPKPVRYVTKRRRDSVAAAKSSTPATGPRFFERPGFSAKDRPSTSPSSPSDSSSIPSYSLTFTSSGSNGSTNGTSDESRGADKSAGEGFTRPKSRIGRRMPFVKTF